MLGFNYKRCLRFIKLFRCRDKDKNWKNHKYVVEGKKLIDWLVEHGDCQNRDEASNFGQTMCENAILHHGKKDPSAIGLS